MQQAQDHSHQLPEQQNEQKLEENSDIYKENFVAEFFFLFKKYYNVSPWMKFILQKNSL